MDFGVLVSYTFSTQGVGPLSPFLTSGLRFNGKWVLVHGSSLSPLRQAEKFLSNKEKDKFFCQNRLKDINVDVTYQDHSNPNKLLPDLIVERGKFVYMWKCQLMQESVLKLMGEWVMQNDSTESEKSKNSKNYLPLFAVVYTGADKITERDVKNNLALLFDLILKRSPIRGEEVQLETTPFGNEFFLNSRTMGVICNTFGTNDCLAVTDATSVLCCEGGPALIQNQIFGIVINSISWWKGEWVGMTLIGCLAPILHQFTNQKHVIQSKSEYRSQQILDFIDSVVVLVKCGESWGSGVSIGNGYYLTCSHVLNEGRLAFVYLNNQLKRAQILVKTPHDRAYDLALLFIDDCTKIPSVQLANTPANKGEIVVAIGYPFFNEEMIPNIKPTISKGRINNVTPFTLQTSCCVQSGFSGGAIVRIHNNTYDNQIGCELLGIIVCNARNEQNGACYPFVNIALPVLAFKNMLDNYMNKKRITSFEDERQGVQKLWNFQYPSKL